MGYTKNVQAELTTARAAKIVIQYLGYPGTVGDNYADYAIVDRFVAPPDPPAEGTHSKYQGVKTSRMSPLDPSQELVGLLPHAIGADNGRLATQGMSEGMLVLPHTYQSTLQSPSVPADGWLRLQTAHTGWPTTSKSYSKWRWG